jgi:hypothetical protein
MRNKRVRRNRNPRPQKRAISPPIVSTQNRKLVWKVAEIDDNSPWGWNKITCPDFLRNIWEKMRNFETMTWVDILGRNHHEIPVNNIIKQAQKRLEVLGHDDEETLVSFHITGQQRIWAIRSGEEAFLLWWDPNHEICPSYLRHT